MLRVSSPSLPSFLSVQTEGESARRVSSSRTGEHRGNRGSVTLPRYADESRTVVPHKSVKPVQSVDGKSLQGREETESYLPTQYSFRAVRMNNWPWAAMMEERATSSRDSSMAIVPRNLPSAASMTETWPSKFTR